MAETESQNQLNAGLRYLTTGAGTVLAIGGMVSLLTPDQVATLKAQIDILNQSIITGYGAISKMAVILGPVLAVLAARAGIKSSSVQGMISKVLHIAANATDPASKSAAVAIANAAAREDISGPGAVVIAPALASHPDAASNVVMSAGTPK